MYICSSISANEYLAEGVKGWILEEDNDILYTNKTIIRRFLLGKILYGLGMHEYLMERHRLMGEPNYYFREKNIIEGVWVS